MSSEKYTKLDFFTAGPLYLLDLPWLKVGGAKYSSVFVYNVVGSEENYVSVVWDNSDDPVFKRIQSDLKEAGYDIIKAGYEDNAVLRDKSTYKESIEEGSGLHLLNEHRMYVSQTWMSLLSIYIKITGGKKISENELEYLIPHAYSGLGIAVGTVVDKLVAKIAAQDTRYQFELESPSSKDEECAAEIKKVYEDTLKYSADARAEAINTAFNHAAEAILTAQFISKRKQEESNAEPATAPKRAATRPRVVETTGEGHKVSISPLLRATNMTSSWSARVASSNVLATTP